MPSIYDFDALSIEGKSVPLSRYRDRPMLIVNTASACGFTPQFAGLEQLHQSYGGRGLVVLGFPCNSLATRIRGTTRTLRRFASATTA